MKITESQLRKIVSEEIKNKLQEQESADKAKVGKSGDKAKVGKSGASDAEGTLDVKKIAETLKVDETKLKTAVTNIRKGARNPTDNAIFGDVFAALLKAPAADTVAVMNALKKVSSEN